MADVSRGPSDTGGPSTPVMPDDIEKAPDVGVSASYELVDEAENNFKPKTLKFWSVMLSIYLALFLVALDRTIIGTAIPQITQDFNSLGDIGWYGSAYQLTTAASQLVFGRVYKFYEVKRTFLFTVAVFEIGSVICGAAPNSIAFILGRAIAGFGGAGIFSGVMIIMLPLVPLRKRPMFQGIFGTIFGVSSVMGPLVGGAFTDRVTWRWCFYINLPIGAAAALCLLLVNIPGKPPQKAGLWEHFTRLDPLGTLFFVPSIVCLLLALQWGGSTYEWNSWRIILLLVLFAVLFLVFAAIQILMPDTATVPVRIITQRSVAAAALFMFAVAGAMLMSIYYLPLWFQVVQGVSAVQSGINTLPLVLSLVVASILSGATTQKIGYYVPAMLVCPSIMAVGLGLMSTYQVGETSAHWIGFQFIVGFGLGVGMQSAGLAAQAVLPKPDIPTGVSIMFFCQQLGGGIFTSVGQNLLSTYMVAHVADVPGLDPKQITSQGATDLVNNVPPQYQLGVRDIYNNAISRIFLCGMGVALVALIAAFFMEWKNIKTMRGAPPVAKASANPGANDYVSTSEEQQGLATQNVSENTQRQSAQLVKDERISDELHFQSQASPTSKSTLVHSVAHTSD
ncbi:MFS general substrate transporter [Hypoxylon rubiginosum]|uniref:MFS general substrate transporter n=1 Tax=Hypoxylon rubiginosum TaxID=110542 RepID=A0ACB9Z234_9PEZI|nr:MFS general substrate transporter [Hypoxylon rubiginosum]